MPQPIEKISLSLYENKIRLEWKMTVENKQFVWEHNQMEIRLYVDPYVSFSEGEFNADLESHHRASGAESSISFNLAVFQATFSGSREVIRKVFRAGTKHYDDDRQQNYYPIYWDFTTANPQNNDSLILYVDWYAEEQEWLHKSFKVTVDFGFMSDDMFESRYKKYHYHEQIDHVLIGLVDKLHRYLHRLKNQLDDNMLLRVLNSAQTDSIYDTQNTTMHDLYTELRVTVTKEIDHFDSEDAIGLFQAIFDSPHVALLGDSGSGKSVSIRFLAFCICNYCEALKEKNDNEKYRWNLLLKDYGWLGTVDLPLFVTLRKFITDIVEYEDTGHAGLLLDYLCRDVERFGISKDTVYEMLESGRTLILLDGLDEVPFKHRKIVYDALKDFISAWDNNRFVVTCRKLNYEESDWRLLSLKEYTILPFSEAEMKQFIHKWYKSLNVKTLAQKRFKDNRIGDLLVEVKRPDLKDIAQNPMLLTVIAWVHYIDGSLPDARVLVYDRCTELLLLKWRELEAKKILELLGQVDEKTKNKLRQILWRLAYNVHEAQPTIDGTANISETDIWLAIKVVTGDLTLTIADKFVDYIQNHTGLLVGQGIDKRKSRLFTFPHRTFQEYLAARHLIQSDFGESITEIIKREFVWRDVILMATTYLTLKESQHTYVIINAVRNLLGFLPNAISIKDWDTIKYAGEILLIMGVKNISNNGKYGYDVLNTTREYIIQLMKLEVKEAHKKLDLVKILRQIGDTRSGIGLRNDNLPDIIWGNPVPIGTYIVGHNKEEEEQDSIWYKDLDTLEKRENFENDNSFKMAKYPITNIQFRAFIEREDGISNIEWWKSFEEHQNISINQYTSYANYPCSNITWYQSVAFCRWLTHHYHNNGLLEADLEIRLPTEFEWEIAARYPHGQKFAWGNEHNVSKINASNYVGQILAVGMYASGRNTALDLYDLNGNIWEWTHTRWIDSEFNVSKALNNLHLSNYEFDDDVQDKSVNHTFEEYGRVLRGGSWMSNSLISSSIFRQWHEPHNYDIDIGFRVVMAPPIEELE